MWVILEVFRHLVQKLEQLWHLHPWRTLTLSCKRPWLSCSSICNSHFCIIKASFHFPYFFSQDEIGVSALSYNVDVLIGLQ